MLNIESESYDQIRYTVSISLEVYIYQLVASCEVLWLLIYQVEKIAVGSLGNLGDFRPTKCPTNSDIPWWAQLCYQLAKEHLASTVSQRNVFFITDLLPKCRHIG